MTLRPPAFWDCGFEVSQASWLSLSCEFCVLLGNGPCYGPVPHPAESCRVCVCVCVIECGQAQH